MASAYRPVARVGQFGRLREWRQVAGGDVRALAYHAPLDPRVGAAYVAVRVHHLGDAERVRIFAVGIGTVVQQAALVPAFVYVRLRDPGYILIMTGEVRDNAR